MIADRAEMTSAPRRILPRATYTVRPVDRRGPSVIASVVSTPSTTLLLNI